MRQGLRRRDDGALVEPATTWALLAAVAFLPALGFLLWVRSRERHGREPVGALLGIFLHGATIGVALAIVLGLVLDLSLARGSLIIAAVVIAPLVEEATKGLGFGWVRRHIDELEDGLVHGVAVGLGFAATETLLYAGLELGKTGADGALGVVLVRNVSSMLLHAGSSALLGFGYAAMRLRHGAWPELLPAYLLAVALHALYNLLVLLDNWLGFTAAVLMVVAVVAGLMRRIRQLDRVAPAPS